MPQQQDESQGESQKNSTYLTGDTSSTNETNRPSRSVHKERSKHGSPMVSSSEASGQPNNVEQKDSYSVSKQSHFRSRSPLQRTRSWTNTGRGPCKEHTKAINSSWST